jgi:hypothetical protein
LNHLWSILTFSVLDFVWVAQLCGGAEPREIFLHFIRWEFLHHVNFVSSWKREQFQKNKISISDLIIRVIFVTCAIVVNNSQKCLVLYVCYWGGWVTTMNKNWMRIKSLNLTFLLSLMTLKYAIFLFLLKSLIFDPSSFLCLWKFSL